MEGREYNSKLFKIPANPNSLDNYPSQKQKRHTSRSQQNGLLAESKHFPEIQG